jgi:RNA polymerase sigma factor (sigma-70 family)
MNQTDFSDIYKIHFDALYNYGKGMGFSHDNCMDAIQDVFCRLYDSNDLDAVDNVRYYLLKCMRNRLLNIYRDYNADRTLYLEEHSFDLKVSLMDSILAKEKQILLVRKVESLLETLTERQKEAVYLRYMYEMKYEDIARLMDITVDSVKQLVHRGIQFMRKNSK